MVNGIILLSDPKGNAYDFSRGVYEKILSLENMNDSFKRREYNFGDVELRKFNDGEIIPRICESVRGKTCFYFHDSSLNPQDWLVSLMLVNDALKRSDAEKVTDVLPYMRYSRQDRMANPRTPISTRVVGKAIESSDVKRVLTTDLHNPSSTNAYDIPFENLRAYPVIVDYLKERYPEFLGNALILSPDAGGAPRADSYSKRLHLGMAVATKQRNRDGAIEKMTISADIYGKNILIVDDIIDTAGTLCRAADELVQRGVEKVYACATHGLFSADAKKRIEDSCLEKVIVTDSVPQKSDGKIEVVSLTDLFSQAIYRIAHKKSLSELYV